MPEPLAKPSMRTPPASDVATLGTVSVVMMALEKTSAPCGFIVETREGMAAHILSTGSGRPMTPVDEMKISEGLQPRLFRQLRSALPRGVHSRFAGHGVGVAGIHQNRPGGVAGIFQVLAGDQNRSSREGVLREDRGRGCGAVGIEKSEIQAAFLDAGGGRGDLETGTAKVRGPWPPALMPRIGAGMRLVDHHRLAVKAIAVELVAGLVGIGGGHFDKGETVADNGHGQNSADHAEKILDGGRLRAVGKVPDQEFLCRCCSCHLNTYAEVRIIIHGTRYSQALF